jgi:hypothetical protein
MTKRIRPFTLAILGLGLLSLLLLVPRWTGSSPARKRPQDQPTPSANVEPTVSTANPAAERDPAPRPPTFPGPGPQAKRAAPGANPLDKLAKSITATPPGSAASYVVRDRETAAFFTSKGVTLAATVPDAGGGKPTPGIASMNWGLVGARETKPRPKERRPRS